MNKTRNAKEGLMAGELEDYTALENVVKDAVLASNEEIRKDAARRLNYASGMCINRGFVENGRIFIELHGPTGKDNVFYICDVPNEYNGVKNPKTYSFDTREI